MSASARWSLVLALLLACSCAAAPAPAPAAPDPRGNMDVTEHKSDAPVEQLEQLKSVKTIKDEPAGREHVEFHRVDSVKNNGELVSRLEEHVSAELQPGAEPDVEARAQVDQPAAGLHKVIVQHGGGHASVLGASTPPPPPPAQEEHTPKVFHGAARLVQAGPAPPAGPAPAAAPHSAARRSFNADITQETDNNMDHYSMYDGVQYSPLDMAEYVFWTGDERGVTAAVETFLREGIMSKEEAISFLQEIKFHLEYLRAQHGGPGPRGAGGQAGQGELRALLLAQAAANEYQPRSPALQSFSFGDSPDIIRTIASKNWELSNNLSPYPPLPAAGDFRPEPGKRGFDPMLTTNILSTSDYDRDGPVLTEEQYQDIMDQLKAADTLYTEYTFEEIIYQLAKMMFSQSLSAAPVSARAAAQRVTAFLELEAARGRISRTIEKKVLNVLVAALTDTLGDHPELLQARDGSSVLPADRMMRQFLEPARRDEPLAGPLHMFAFPERN